MTDERSFRVLIVDDETLVSAAMQRQLRRRGFEVETSDTPRDALERLFAAGGAPFDILVSDYRMTQMNGLELLAEVRRRAPAIVRVLVSGYVDGETSEPSAEAPFELFVRKPWNADELAAGLRALARTRPVDGR